VGDDGPASKASLATPRGVAVAPNGDLLVADSANDRIRRVSSRTGGIDTVAGGGVYALPGSRKVRLRPLRSAPPAGRVQATLFEAVSPRFVAVDRAGNVFFSATDGPVYRIDATDGALSALGAGRRESNAADSPVGFRGIGGIAVDSTGDLVVAAASGPSGRCPECLSPCLDDACGLSRRGRPGGRLSRSRGAKATCQRAARRLVLRPA
jgi:streptogramin lyase